MTSRQCANSGELIDADSMGIRLLRGWCATVFFAVLLNTPFQAFAGYAGGPYVVWVNLDRSSEGERVDKIVADYATAKPVNCAGRWKMGDSLLYMKKTPGIDWRWFGEDVFLRKKQESKKQLSSALRNYKDVDFRHVDGLDGIIVYTTEGGTRMMSLTTGKRKIESVAIGMHGRPPVKGDIEDAFCALLPPITRAP